MYIYGKVSSAKLLTCHQSVERIARIGLRRSPYDISIVHGFRGEILQNELHALGASNVLWPHSKHNHMSNDQPQSLAIDFAPYVKGRIPWEDTHIFAVIAGNLLSVAYELDIEAVWGGDFNMDGSTKDQTLLDYGHIHIILRKAHG